MDSNGNQTYDGTQVYTYDGWNRLKTVSHGYRDSAGALHQGQTMETMTYDARGRRTVKSVNTGPWACTYHYYYDGNHQLEQRSGSNAPIRQNVWGIDYVDDLVQTSLNSSPYTKNTCDVQYWACQDANWNVIGVVNASGVVQERYEYTPYGQRQVYYSAGSNDPLCYSPTAASERFVASGTTEPWGICEFGHQGLMHDEESGLVYDRARYLSPMLGRFLARDAVAGYDDGMTMYQYVGSNPTDHDDPTGSFAYIVNNESQGLYWFINGGGADAQIGNGLINDIRGWQDYSDTIKRIKENAELLASNVSCHSGQQIFHDYDSTVLSDPLLGINAPEDHVVLGAHVDLKWGADITVTPHGNFSGKDETGKMHCSCCAMLVQTQIRFTAEKHYSFSAPHNTIFQAIPGTAYNMYGFWTDGFNFGMVKCDDGYSSSFSLP